MHSSPQRPGSPVDLDRKYLWHPFTQMADWMKTEPIVIAQGHGAVLIDTHGRQYIDANSSIWTNLHGHRHPVLNGAIRRQLSKIAHSSALGLANEPAGLLGEKLIHAAATNPRFKEKNMPSPSLERVFFSDDGSTAMEVALKQAYEFARRSGRSARPRFLSLAGAYHGDTVGAVSLGHIDLFHKAYSQLLFPTDKTAAPYCYRCPYNRARPERADARDYAKCGSECLSQLEQKLAAKRRRGEPYAGFIFEPLMQGAAGMIAQPRGWLRKATTLAREHGALLIADEVMTGFGRMGTGLEPETNLVPKGNQGSYWKASRLFACQLAGVFPDFMALAKGLTGGYLPMAATLTTRDVFSAFLGHYDEFKTFFHGHSFTGNQLGAAAGLASLDLLQTEKSVRARVRIEREMRESLRGLWDLPNVGDIRQEGLTAGIELVRDWRTREPFRPEEKTGIRVCEAMARHGVLTRPVGNVIVIIPPYCTTNRQLQTVFDALRKAVQTLEPKRR